MNQLYPFVEFLELRRDELVSEWERWRDAQTCDEHRNIVDESYTFIIADYDASISALMATLTLSRLHGKLPSMQG